jgi:hypothetical protein
MGRAGVVRLAVKERSEKKQPRQAESHKNRDKTLIQKEASLILPWNPENGKRS